MSDIEDILTWDHLPLEPLLRVFSFLQPLELCRVSAVNHHWRECGNRDEVWKPLCSVWISSPKELTKNNLQGLPYKEVYMSYSNEWKRYSQCYTKVKRTWDTIIGWLEKHHPEIIETLQPGASEQEIDDFETETGLRLDDEMRCSYRMFNGQKSKINIRHGLFGGYKCYDFHVNLRLMSLASMKAIHNQIKQSEEDIPLLYHLLPVARSYNALKHLFVVGKDLPVPYHKGRVIEFNQTFEDVFPVADNFLKLLTDYADNLTSGNFAITESNGPKEINRYPHIRGVSNAVTNGVDITSCPLFVPERSSVNPPNYFFAYKIIMKMDKSYPKEATCKLTTRHWVIRDANNRNDEVQGPGVIGMYPEMYPGAYFEYESCCPLATPSGRMGGSFQMRVRATGTEFDAVVADYHFNSPAPLPKFG